MIPNVVHFCFGLKQQTEEFYFTYYIAILSAKLVNNPDIIYFYYHYEPYGKWWDLAKQYLTLEKVDIPTYIGKKPVIKVAHAADVIRMNKLHERGGIYLDIDTICVRPYKHLLENSCVLGIEDPGAICNAIMMTEPSHSFFTEWLDKYEQVFVTDGWGEASILLPWKIYHSENNFQNVKLMSRPTFFEPSWRSVHDIFRNNVNIPPELISLHLWESMSMKYIKVIKDMKWIHANPHTLYAKLVVNLKNYGMEEM